MSSHLDLITDSIERKNSKNYLNSSINTFVKNDTSKDRIDTKNISKTLLKNLRNQPNFNKNRYFHYLLRIYSLTTPVNIKSIFYEILIMSKIL